MTLEVWYSIYNVQNCGAATKLDCFGATTKPEDLLCQNNIRTHDRSITVCNLLISQNNPCPFKIIYVESNGPVRKYIVNKETSAVGFGGKMVVFQIAIFLQV